MNNDFKLTADAQDLFGENPAVLRIIDSRLTNSDTEVRVAPVGMNGPITAESFLCYRSDLEPIRPFLERTKTMTSKSTRREAVAIKNRLHDSKKAVNGAATPIDLDKARNSMKEGRERLEGLLAKLVKPEEFPNLRDLHGEVIVLKISIDRDLKNAFHATITGRVNVVTGEHVTPWVGDFAFDYDTVVMYDYSDDTYVVRVEQR